MLRASFTGLRTILCIGAHADDIEIGCGGTILRILAEYEMVNVSWVVLSANQNRRDEAVRSANLFLTNAHERKIEIKSFHDTFFPYIGTEIKEYFNRLGRTISPDAIFTHCLEDRHQDHRLVSELTWNTFRDHLIMEYEIPKYEGDLGNPNIFVPLTEPVCKKKIEIIINTFKSQESKQWFTADVFLAMLRIRGVEANSPSNFAEALYCRKLIV